MRQKRASPQRGAMWAIFVASAMLYAFLASPKLEFSPPFGKGGAVMPAGEPGKLAGPRLEADDSGAIWLADSQNGSRTLIPLAGSPFGFGERLFIMRPDQKGASEIESDGRLAWSREFGSLVTSFALSERESLWGLLDGSIVLIGANGDILFRGQLPADGNPSKYRCVYGVGISPDGGRIASISGLEPQRMTVFGRQADSLAPEHDRIVGQPVRSAQAILFSGDGTWLVAGIGEDILAYDCVSKKSVLLAPPAGGIPMVTGGLFPLGKDTIAVMRLPADPSERGGKSLCFYRRGAFEGMLPLSGAGADVFVRGDALHIIDDAGTRKYEVTGR